MPSRRHFPPPPPAAVDSALRAQQALLTEVWSEIGVLRVRMAIDVGEAAPDARGDYLAAPLNRLSRLLAAGHGGQILFTQLAQQLVWDSLPADTSRSDLGEHQLRDLFRPPAGPNRAHYQAPGVTRAFP